MCTRESPCSGLDQLPADADAGVLGKHTQIHHDHRIGIQGHTALRTDSWHVQRGAEEKKPHDAITLVSNDPAEAPIRVG